MELALTVAVVEITEMERTSTDEPEIYRRGGEDNFVGGRGLGGGGGFPTPSLGKFTCSYFTM